MGDIKDPVLNRLRKEIDECDNKLWRVLEARTELVKKVKARKKKKGLPIRDFIREAEMVIAAYKQTTLPRKFVRAQLRFLIKWAIKLEEGK